MSETSDAGPLAGVRVLDFATPLAEATGRVLADLGAEVIKIEPRGGCASRFTPPFELGRERDADGSLFWRAWGLGKHSVVLDPGDDRERLLDLVRGADVLVESSAPGAMEALGLGAQALLELNPSLIYVSVTPFGQTGPLAGSPASDLTLAAAGGLVNMQGDRDRPPVPVGFPETSCHGAVQAAADAILCLTERQRTGLGQHLDTSMQAAMPGTLLFVTGYGAFGLEVPGTGEARAEPPPELIPGLRVPDRARCKDGDVVMTLVLGEVGARSFGSIMRWVAESGGLDDDLAALDWSRWLELVATGKLPPADAARGFDQFIAFLGTRTKAEIHERSLAGKWLIAPALNTAELLADPQLASRGYWTAVDGTTHPGPFARLSETPIQYRRPAPALGQDQALIESERPWLAVATATESEPASLLGGLKIADFSWVGAGPLVSKDLANLGATVLRVESENHVDPLRFIPPWKDGIPNVSTGHPMADMNQSKLGVALDFGTDAGREVALRMVDWADVVIESFTPGTAKRLGLDYQTLQRRKPDLVMLSSCMRGQTGPERTYTGFGLQGAALAGFVAITGWPDRIASGPWGAYTDFIAPRFSLCALGAALFHRARTGQGQYVDLSQIEAAMHFLEPLILDYAVNGRVAEKAGHDSQRACPHGVFAAGGVEHYVAIAVESDEQWRSLCELVPALGPAAAATDLPARITRKDELESILARYCRGEEASTLAYQLRAAGIPAYVVLRACDMLADEQLTHRGFFVELDHPQIGPSRYNGPVTHFSRTPARPHHAGPPIGHHTFEALRDIVGISEDELSELAARGGLT